jgi:hypothetical protein
MTSGEGAILESDPLPAKPSVTAQDVIALQQSGCVGIGQGP